tara:strand:- start:149 stop:316 length:168 start_codon:yes stop_codon:yes gene_type:complete
MNTYRLVIVMDAIDEDDFISVLLEMKHREFKPHIEQTYPKLGMTRKQIQRGREEE